MVSLYCFVTKMRILVQISLHVIVTFLSCTSVCNERAHINAVIEKCNNENFVDLRGTYSFLRAGSRYIGRKDHMKCIPLRVYYDEYNDSINIIKTINDNLDTSYGTPLIQECQDLFNDNEITNILQCITKYEIDEYSMSNNGNIIIRFDSDCSLPVLRIEEYTGIADTTIRGIKFKHYKDTWYIGDRSYYTE